MADRISVNVSELQKYSQRIQKHLEKYNMQVYQLANQNFAKINLSWKGSDSLAFTNNANDYINDLKELSSQIEAYVSFIKMAVEKYNQQVQDNCTVANAAKGK